MRPRTAPRTRRSEPPAYERAQGPAGKVALPIRVLVFGDPRVIRHAATDRLRAAGCGVEWVANPREALARLRAGAADLLVTDLGTPTLPGWVLASQARAIRPDLPIFLVTAFAPVLDRPRLAAAGITRVLDRSSLPEDLLAAVAETPAPAPLAV